MIVAQKRQSLWVRLWKSAGARVGGTPIERLDWLLRFSTSTRRELSALGKSKLLQHYYELSNFAAPAGMDFRGLPLPADRLADLAETVGKGVKFLCEPRPDEKGGPEDRSAPWYRGPTWRVDLSQFGCLESAIEARTFRSFYGGDLPAVFVVAAMDLLAAEGRRIAKCAWGPCGRLFVRRKRGAYCSPACSQRDRTRRYLKKKGAGALSESRHKYYVDRVERLKGPSFSKKVRRRTPREGTNPTITRGP